MTDYIDTKGWRVTTHDSAAEEVEFFQAGGGFVHRASHEYFHTTFKPAPAPVLRRGRVDADWFDEGVTLPCWSDGSLWNGWSMPLFPRAAANELVERSQRGDLFPMRWEGDIIVIVEDEIDEEGTIRVAPKTMPNGELAWDIGAGNWCWNSVDFEVAP